MTLEQEDITIYQHCILSLTFTCMYACMNAWCKPVWAKQLTHPIMLSTKAFQGSTVLPLKQAGPDKGSEQGGAAVKRHRNVARGLFNWPATGFRLALWPN